MTKTAGTLAAVLWLAAGWMALPAADLSVLPEEIQRSYNAGHYQQAAQALEAAVRESPQRAELHFWLGRCYYEWGDFSRASASLERAVELAPGNSEYHDWLGKAYGRRAERANFFSAFSLARKTVGEFEEAVRLDPSNRAAQRNLIRYYLNAPGIVGGGDDKALRQIAALAKIDPVQGQLAQAEYFASRKQYALADGEYQKILRAGGGEIGVYLEIAEYYRDRGEAERMQEAVAAAARAVPNDRRLPYYRGVALVLAKQEPAMAERYLRQYLNTVPDNTDVPPRASAHEWLGKLYEGLNRLDQATREYEAALSLDPRNKGVAEALKRVRNR